MREVIAVCRSEKKSREKVARVLDRYFWRIGDHTWRGKATNACLDRVSRELRRDATRNTAVVIHEIRSAHESRVPIVRIGARHAFSEDGIASIASHPAEYRRGRSTSASERSAAAAVRLAALFHDLGKSTVLFQEKLKRAIKGDRNQADPIRHELHSAAVWDHLFGDVSDKALPKTLEELSPDKVDEACRAVIKILGCLPNTPKGTLRFRFLCRDRENSLSHLIGMLILTHHRLPDGDSDLLKPLASRHARSATGFSAAHDLAIASGTPFWHETWWQDRVVREARALAPGNSVLSPDIALRASLMLADHLGSSEKKASESMPEHLANSITINGEKKPRPADSLSVHVKRVYANARHMVDLFHRYAGRFPGLEENQIPIEIAFPQATETPQFQWQGAAARSARKLCENSEGGFFACIMAGTGTGKTRGAPTILAGAALGDARTERRYFRMSLGLGLRVLATQSARQYVADLGFNKQDVSVIIGQAPLSFAHGEDRDFEDIEGSESRIDIPDWLKVEMATGGVPAEGSSREADWLRSLSCDTSRGLPAFCERILGAAGTREDSGFCLLSPPVMVGTIDHLMGVASPVNSRFLIQTLRVMTSDLVLDEIDQFNGEDIAAIGRLVYQAAATGRRVIVMSATLTLDIAKALDTAYRRGWAAYSAARGLRDHVNLLITGDAPGSCMTNEDGQDIECMFLKSSDVTLKALKVAPPARRAEILAPCNGWEDLVQQIDAGCTRLHDLNAVKLDEFKVSAGMVRMTRIAHTAALAAQMPSGYVAGRLRVTLCLHSQFPRLHRGWIETRLKRALTRKADDPNAGLRELCHETDLFRRADKLGVREIEIVVVTSPVIETGNDLDFDWAVLDPISTRSIIQSAGRVQRHRPVEGEHVNVLILGRSPIAMQDGKLSMPGVETDLHCNTLVQTPTSLKKFEDRHFKDLAGDMDFTVINATPILSGATAFPLGEAEAEVRRAMIRADIDCAEAPLGRYISRLNARLTQKMPCVRRFRRSDRKTVLYKLVGEDFNNAAWYVDLAPGTRDSVLSEAKDLDLGDTIQEWHPLFDAVTECAWADIYQDREVSPADIGRLMQVEIPDNGNETYPTMAYTLYTGFTRGSSQDLFKPFGKAS